MRYDVHHPDYDQLRRHHQGNTVLSGRTLGSLSRHIWFRKSKMKSAVARTFNIWKHFNPSISLKSLSLKTPFETKTCVEDLCQKLEDDDFLMTTMRAHLVPVSHPEIFKKYQWTEETLVNCLKNEQFPPSNEVLTAVILESGPWTTKELIRIFKAFPFHSFPQKLALNLEMAIVSAMERSTMTPRDVFSFLKMLRSHRFKFTSCFGVLILKNQMEDAMDWLLKRNEGRFLIDI